MSMWRKETVALDIDGTALEIALMRCDGKKPPVLFLHGFGSTKEDYADAELNAAFEDRALIAYDAPGCGASDCDNLAAISIPFLVKTAIAVADHCSLSAFHLVGHSMGGLTSLKLATSQSARVLSFADIEGNIAPEDCFLSRQIIDHPADDPQSFLTAFKDRVWSDPIYSHALYAASLAHKVRAEAVSPIFRSMVELSDNEPLFDAFTGLSCPRMFVFGTMNRSLSYLPELLMRGVQLAEISQSGHFPMYSNPQALWERLGQFIDLADRANENATR